jgi:hypothetical protein
MWTHQPPAGCEARGDVFQVRRDDEVLDLVYLGQHESGDHYSILIELEEVEVLQPELEVQVKRSRRAA